MTTSQASLLGHSVRVAPGGLTKVEVYNTFASVLALVFLTFYAQDLPLPVVIGLGFAVVVLLFVSDALAKKHRVNKATFEKEFLRLHTADGQDSTVAYSSISVEDYGGWYTRGMYLKCTSFSYKWYFSSMFCDLEQVREFMNR